jgi:hypothetical protein
MAIQRSFERRRAQKVFRNLIVACRVLHFLRGENAYSARAAQGLSLGRPAQIFTVHAAFFAEASAFPAAPSAPSISAYFVRDNMFYLDFYNVSAGKHPCFSRDNMILIVAQNTPRFTCAFATFSQVVHLSRFVAPRDLIVASANGGARHA